MLKGQRVLLRAMEKSDLEHLHAFNNDIEVELAGGGDPPMPQSFARLEAEFGQRSGGGGRDNAGFAIEVEEKFIGMCALFNFDETARTCELGITIGDKAYWGKGYGREVIALLVEYAFHYRNFRKVWLKVNGKNERAQKAYRAVGFVEEGRQKAQIWSAGEYDDLVYMGLLRPD
jgi:RimJ/RimL family protein N-acetyltransferase